MCSLERLKILNKKEAKKALSLIKSQWDADYDITGYAFLKSTADKLYLVSEKALEFSSKMEQQKLRISSFGMYFAAIHKTSLRLSVEASQIIGMIAKKNVLELTDGQMQQWLEGKDIENINNGSSCCTDNSADNVFCTANKENNSYENCASGFVILSRGSLFLGCGKIKPNRLINFYPKARRLLAVAD